MKIIAFIEQAFSARRQPEIVVIPNYPETDEYLDALQFRAKTWQSLCAEDWDKYPAAVYGFSPEAFCYFLPSILSIGIREQCPYLLVNYSLIEMLDKSPEPSLWDQFFIDRWPNLTQKECEAIQKWILWLTTSDIFSDDTCTRAYETLELLIQG